MFNDNLLYFSSSEQWKVFSRDNCYMCYTPIYLFIEKNSLHKQYWSNYYLINMNTGFEKLYELLCDSGY